MITKIHKKLIDDCYAGCTQVLEAAADVAVAAAAAAAPAPDSPIRDWAVRWLAGTDRSLGGAAAALRVAQAAEEELWEKSHNKTTCAPAAAAREAAWAAYTAAWVASGSAPEGAGRRVLEAAIRADELRALAAGEDLWKNHRRLDELQAATAASIAARL